MNKNIAIMFNADPILFDMQYNPKNAEMILYLASYITMWNSNDLWVQYLLTDTIGSDKEYSTHLLKLGTIKKEPN